MINLSDRDAVMEALLSGRRIRLPSGAGDKKRLATCVENIRKEVTSSPERVAGDAVAISLLPVPLASNGYRAHDRAFFEDIKATMGCGGIGLDAGTCTSCGDLLLPGTMAEPNAAVMLLPHRPTPDQPAASGILCLSCMAERFAFSGQRVARWFVEHLFGTGIADLVRLPPPTTETWTALYVDPRIMHWQERWATRAPSFWRARG